ncbi:MAG: hypothetical protein QNJ90_16200 [Planctomycetota bacterium]|nr:hypothetical protein [Planctomycetota bacterium]
MDEPRLPPVVAGRSALPAFLAVEAWARDKTADARAAADAHRAEAEAEAANVRREGEEALKQAVLDGEREALRDVETAQRDKVSEARRAVETWIRDAEEASTRAVAEALDLLLRGPDPDHQNESGEGQ